MPFFPFVLVLFIILVNLCTVHSIDAEIMGSGDLKMFSFDARIDRITLGPPDYQGDLFADPRLASQGSLLANSDANPAVVGSGSTASGGQGPLLATLDTSSIVSDTGPTAQETKERLFANLNVASDAADTIPILPEDQGHPFDGSIIDSSPLETDTTAPKDQGQIVASTLDLEAAVPDCGIGQIDQAKQLSCPLPLNQGAWKPPIPDYDRPSEFIEPPHGLNIEKLEYGEPSPWIEGLDGISKRCSNTKYTLCCNGPTHLTQWVANCVNCM